MVSCGGPRPHAGRVRAVDRRQIRLTRRGRRVRGVLVSVISLGVLAAPPVLASQPGIASPDRGAEASELVVEPGDSLWSVAVRHAPTRDPFVTIEQIRRLNRLSGYVVHPGQRLRLP